MIALIQRVREASVSVDGAEVGRIGSGLLALIGIEKGDGEAEAKRLVERVMHYRVFADAAGRMNRSLIDVNGALLAVSQFTLVADTQSGTRPGFSRGATPEDGAREFARFVDLARGHIQQVHSGVFGADMQVQLINDGPVTFWLQVKPALQ